MRRTVLTLASVASALPLACRRQSVLQLSLMTVALLLACLALAEQPAEGHAGHLGGTPPAWNPQVPSGFTFDQVADIGSAGTDMEIVPSSGRLFAADQSGYVVSVDHATGDKRRVLDITSLTPGDTNGERGLHSILAHPDFAENGWLYVAYTRRTMGGVAVHNRISRFTWDATSQTFPKSSEVLVRKYPSRQRRRQPLRFRHGVCRRQAFRVHGRPLRAGHPCARLGEARTVPRLPVRQDPQVQPRRLDPHYQPLLPNAKGRREGHLGQGAAQPHPRRLPAGDRQAVVHRHRQQALERFGRL